MLLAVRSLSQLHAPTPKIADLVVAANIVRVDDGDGDEDVVEWMRREEEVRTRREERGEEWGGKCVAAQRGSQKIGFECLLDAWVVASVKAPCRFRCCY
jgi:hypothetical protein